ncbi:hypothetical protein MTR67_004462 [Solanum verrucosum]|uniref:Uncharacterized protein n=1 Tax=Solanum verrucosum TaxID=315347 RepID=A0AAF0T7T5_SOLVR|nr:hypothetical protein MTR67_004462 [Solanum verrucosum]
MGTVVESANQFWYNIWGYNNCTVKLDTDFLDLQDACTNSNTKKERK